MSVYFRCVCFVLAGSFEQLVLSLCVASTVSREAGPCAVRHITWMTGSWVYWMQAARLAVSSRLHSIVLWLSHATTDVCWARLLLGANSSAPSFIFQAKSRQRSYAAFKSSQIKCGTHPVKVPINQANEKPPHDKHDSVFSAL